MIKDDLLDLVKDQFSRSDIKMDQELADEDIDSIELLDFIMSIEEKFEIEFTDEELDEIKTLNDIAEIIRKKTNED